jgi:hypothetical protein
MNTRANLNGKFKRNSAAEDARIKAGVKADSDTRELRAADFAAMTPFPEAMRRRRGRPKATTHKVPVTVRLEPRARVLQERRPRLADSDERYSGRVRRQAAAKHARSAIE